MNYVHYNDLNPELVDKIVLRVTPAYPSHIHFEGATVRFREEMDWVVDARTGRAVVHESLNRLIKSGLIVMGNHPSGLFYYRLGGKWKNLEEK